MNLVGWATMVLFALVYNAMPSVAKTKMAAVHFWIAQLGMILIIIGLWVVLHDNTSGEPVLVIGETLTALSMLIFGYLVWRTPATCSLRTS